ncbi:hypothetical protein D3Z38_13895 [Clostridiales bacterium]|nr:hypothetical protein [Clostridiales bacterium]
MSSAVIEINGITVIAGENDTGKSKVSLVSSPDALREIIKFDAGFAQHQDQNELEAAMQKIIDVLRLSDQDILRAFLARNLNEEFNFQITNLFSSEQGGNPTGNPGKVCCHPY